MPQKLLIVLTLFFSSCNFLQPSEPVVAIQPFHPVSEKTVQTVKQALKNYYGVEVVVQKPVDLPAQTYYPPRHRYRADKLIAYLKENIPSDCDKIIGITDKDISTSIKGYEDYGIMGLAYLGGMSSVISEFRLKKKLKDQNLFKDRITKDALHEIGHTLGLPHCETSEYCFMQDAKGKVATLDKAKKSLCESCISKLPINLSN